MPDEQLSSSIMPRRGQAEKLKEDSSEGEEFKMA